MGTRFYDLQPFLSSFDYSSIQYSRRITLVYRFLDDSSLKSKKIMLGGRKDEPSSRLVRNLLAAAASSREEAKQNLTTPPFSTADHNRAIPKRPPSANPTSKRRARSSSARGRGVEADAPDRSAKVSK